MFASCLVPDCWLNRPLAKIKSPARREANEGQNDKAKIHQCLGIMRHDLAARNLAQRTALFANPRRRPMGARAASRLPLARRRA
jgi:hypothetical protein